MRLFRRGDESGDKAERGARRSDPYAVYLGLRGIPLGERGGPSEPFEGTHVIAVLLDWGQPNGAATIATVADGTSSLYTSTGGGVIGAGAHVPVRDASSRLMRVAADHLEEFEPTTEAPVPANGRLAIVIRTTEGLRRTEVAYGDLEGRTAPGQAVFDAANDLMTAIRITTQAQERTGAGGPPSG
jgi:hypothetical protein